MQNRAPVSQTSLLTARLFGVPSFMRDGMPIELHERKNRALLAFLALSPGVARSRDQLVELFWPRSAARGGRASLRQALSTIRSAIGDPHSEILLADREGVRLNPARLSSDVGRMLDDATQADPEADLFAGLLGVLLDGMSGISAEFDSWRSTEQARVSALAAARMQAWGEIEEAAGRFAKAEAWTEQALALDPTNEVLLRRLMRLNARQGRHARALDRYQRLQLLLSDDLGVLPEAETQDLAREIRADRLRPNKDRSTRSTRGPTATVPATRLPRTQYARSGEVNIAFQVHGDGPVDLVYVPGWVSNLDLAWGHPTYARFLEQLGTFARVIRLDKRGTGLSDRNVGHATLEQRMDDLRAVMDAAGSERAVLLGSSEGGNLCMSFAATWPRRTVSLILYGAYARGLWAEDYPWAKTVPMLEGELAAIARDWGGPFDFSAGAPSLSGDLVARNWFATYLRQSASPQDALSLWRWSAEVDMRPLLAAIRVPTLVIHRTGDRWVKREEGRYLAERITGARFVELPGDDHIIWASDTEPVFAQIKDHLTNREAAPSEAVLATLLCLRIHCADDSSKDDPISLIAKEEAPRFGGSAVSGKPGFLLFEFPGATRAVVCASRIRSRSEHLQCSVQAAIHIGECMRGAGTLSGDAVDMVEQLAASASRSTVLLSETVRALITGSDIQLGNVVSVPAAGGSENTLAYPVISLGPHAVP